jgi:quinoprotein glucose dehydrogenase
MEHRRTAGRWLSQPMIYSINGQQFVVIACGGGGKPGSPMGDSYVAFALPVKE